MRDSNKKVMHEELIWPQSYQDSLRIISLGHYEQIEPFQVMAKTIDKQEGYSVTSSNITTSPNTANSGQSFLPPNSTVGIFTFCFSNAS